MATQLLNSAPAAEEVQAEQPVVSRAEVAATTRAFQDINAQISNVREVLKERMTDAASMGPEAFAKAWKAREHLNQLHQQSKDLSVALQSHMPSPSDFNAQLTPQEKNQIVALYASGLYTQQQLATQYGVSQPTVGRAISDAQKA